MLRDVVIGSLMALVAIAIGAFLGPVVLDPVPAKRMDRLVTEARP